MDKKVETVQTYNRSAKQLSERFDNFGARRKDIGEVFQLIHKENPKVLEVGCGNGRDGKEILKYTSNYIGIDISEGLIEEARTKNPDAKCEVADMELYKFPDNLDIIFSFASLVHIPREGFNNVMGKCLHSLNREGTLRLSTKLGSEYKELTKNDEFGTRTYYLYPEDEIDLLTRDFKTLKKEILNIRGELWLEGTYQKH